MKKFLILLMLMASPLVAVAQLQYISDRAVATNPFTGGMVPLSYAQVRVCSTVNSIAASPCPNIAQIYDVNGNPYPTSLGSNFGQLTTDVLGRFNFACVTGNYNIQVQASGNNTPSINEVLSCPGNVSYLATDNTWTGLNSFTQAIQGNLAGNVTSSGTSSFNILNATSLNGPLTGNVTGNVTGNLNGNVTSTGTNSMTTLNATTINASTFFGVVGSPASHNTGIFGILAVYGGVDGTQGGIKHQRASTGSITNGTRVGVVITWTNAFADASYTPVCTVLDTSATGAGLSVERISAQSAASITVQVFNQAAGALTGTLNCIAMHDSGVY